MMNSKLGILFVVTLAGCATGPQWNWYKPNSNEAEFNSAKYSCLQKAQQPYSSASAYNSGGIVSSQAITTQSSSAGIATNNALYEACLSANGWTKRYTQNITSSNGSPIKMSPTEAQETCARTGYKIGTYPYEECVKSRSGR